MGVEWCWVREMWYQLEKFETLQENVSAIFDSMLLIKFSSWSDKLQTKSPQRSKHNKKLLRRLLHLIHCNRINVDETSWEISNDVISYSHHEMSPRRQHIILSKQLRPKHRNNKKKFLWDYVSWERKRKKQQLWNAPAWNKTRKISLGLESISLRNSWRKVDDSLNSFQTLITVAAWFSSYSSFKASVIINELVVWCSVKKFPSSFMFRLLIISCCRIRSIYRMKFNELHWNQHRSSKVVCGKFSWKGIDWKHQERKKES